MKMYIDKKTLCVFLSLTLVLTLALGLSHSKPVRAATLTVDGTCTDSNGDGLCDDGVTYKTIQAAVNAAVAGDTVQVLPATYPERVLIDKPLIVNGDPGDLATAGPGGNAPIVDGGGAAGYGFRIAAGVDNVSVSGFIIQNYGAGPESAGGQSAGVGAVNPTLDPTTAITVSDNRFEDINWASVFFFNGGQSTFQNIAIQYNVVNVGPWALDTNVYGIECTNCANATIAHNVVSGGANGIVLSAQGSPAYPVTAADNAILNNEVRNADEGDILLMSYDPTWTTGAPRLQGTRIEGNTLTNDGTLGVQGNSAILVYSYENGVLDGLSVLNNTITVAHCDNIPLDLATASNITLDGNAITVANPVVAGRVLYLNTVGGSHINVLNNQIAIQGVTTAEHFHAVDLNGGEAPGARSRSGAGVWSIQHAFPLPTAKRTHAVTSRPGFEGARISGNTFTSERVGAHSAGVRLRETLPATATVSVLNNTIRGFYSGIWPNAPLNFYVRDNQLLQNDYGLLTSGSGYKLNLIATGNVISGNGVAGIALAAGGPISATLGGSLAAANTFRNNGPGGALNLRVELPASNPIVEATFNDWGPTDVCDIAATFDERSGVRLVHYYDMLAAAAPTIIPADNATPSHITGTLTGLYAPAGNVVSFTTNLGVLTPETDLADVAGEAHSALRSDTEGTATVVATAGMACAYTEADQVAVVVRNAGPGPHLV
ncbi:MAG TPA: NosD domain-containing protein, partial [Anaerolineae bacterium]|nr:NosD domain-containing protein [Anaerolineae bacterium]